jgi:tripartite-type tricarboxylate transporter receptor subunit TctC
MNDLSCRMLSDPLSKILGVPVVVENKPGGGGGVGADYVAKTKPDGYTILSGSNAAVILVPITQGLYRLKDFRPICLFGRVPTLVVVRSDSPYKTIEDLVSFGKKNPGKLTLGSIGQGSYTYFTAEIFKAKSGVKMDTVPFNAPSNAMTALLGGHIDMLVDTLSAVRGVIESKMVQPLLVLPKTRFLPGIPSFEEKGFSGVVGIWLGYFVPSGTPEPVFQKLSQAFENATRSPSVTSQAEKLGITLDFIEGQKFHQEILAEYKAVEEAAKKMGLAK